ncbi:hypothetical protein K491DRAFT_703960 [Lophiostoma macrostomum CBS 122681]|uniref:U1-type domain-containing protein n=1 Tax=Lophiostoma macrostomum CBS 122681 TaxID=1314788 RepID=A0A6A6T937_9PLEO|nr:hypothetical protein K491DRAFT_703960 [Lophiostoma macrostomum CBS 122681]
MAEYWKSTPKYWCKFCEVFVKDTKFERAQHEATGRHQGNIQRSLRGLHRKQEAEQREKQRAKDEIARLNGLVPGSASSSAAASTGARAGAKPTFSKVPEKPITLEERKRQLRQLADMGVAMPQEFRGEMAMAGDWQVVSERVVGEEEQKPLNTGVHKRKLDEDEEEQLAAGVVITKKKGWGNTFKSFPGKMSGGDDDVEVLFKKAKKSARNMDLALKEEDALKEDDKDGVKEEGDENTVHDVPTEEEAAAAKPDSKSIGVEEEVSPAPTVVFKKRKKIAR